MRQIERNGPLFADDIQVVDDKGGVFILNQRTKALMSGVFRLTAENMQDVMKQCFEAGQQAKAAELRKVLGIPA
jgi:hypothetical protein